MISRCCFVEYGRELYGNSERLSVRRKKRKALMMYKQKPIRVETCNGPLCAWKQAPEYSICFVPYLEQQERNIHPVSSQEHRDAIPPMFSREINWSEGFPNMVLSTEYSEAVNARYTFQSLWVSRIRR